MYDCLIIGAGVTGCSIARALSKFKVNACVLEKEEDVCFGTSKANSAIIHAGFDAAHGSLMAKMNVLGNRLMDQLAKDLDIPFRRNGSLVVCLSEEDRPKLLALYQRGVDNGVEGHRIFTREETLEMEPNLSEDIVGALYAPTGGIVCPFQMTIALAENACENGVQFFFNTKVFNIVKIPEGFRIETNRGEYRTKCVVNAAGVYADEVHNMVSGKKMKITPRRGDYLILDKNTGSLVDKTIFTVPGKLGKGVLVSPTIHGNLIVGPTAIDIEDKDATATTKDGMDEVISKASLILKALPFRQVIASFAGLRAHEAGHEFILGEAEDVGGFFDAAGIESPGLSSAPAIGQVVAALIREKMGLEINSSFNPIRKGIVDPKELSMEERNNLIQKNPAYGTIICRCESVTEGEIIESIRRPLGAKSLDGVKRRTRAGTGRCQAGFCAPKVMEILARERNIPFLDVTKSGGASQIVSHRTKESKEGGAN